jgi:Flp pilus assembly protein TadG
METAGKTRSARTASQRGAAIIESAIILLVFLLILFGIFELGRIMNAQETLTNAAREAARFASTPIAMTNNLPTNAQITTMVDGFLQASGITGANVTITRPVVIPTGPVQTEYTRVRVDLQYQPVLGTLFFVNTVNLKGEALMRNETSP